MSAELFEMMVKAGADAGCPQDQVSNFLTRGIVLQPRQLRASAMARACDRQSGPTQIGYGGARGGGKSHWLFAQIGADDCQRVPGLKVLLLRKVGKANLESIEDLRRRIFANIPHSFAAHKGILSFPNGSRIVAGHFQSESDIDAYLGLEYDAIGVEEATTLSHRKYLDISTCCRTSKPNWRPRIYSTANPGGVGHGWYRKVFINPMLKDKEGETRFVQATVSDNKYCNAEYRGVLERLQGWQRRAWLDGDWDIAAGQYFSNWRRDVHVIDDFDTTRAQEWFAALDYGFTHYTVVLLGCKDSDGNVFVVDEHAQRLWLPQRHASGVNAMVERHSAVESRSSRGDVVKTRPLKMTDLARLVAGADVFSRQSDGSTIAGQYAQHGIRLKCASTDRVNGWAEILKRLGDVDGGIKPSLFIHKRCGRLVETLPAMQHDPNRPEDVLKVDCDENGNGGDDAVDCLRYLVHYQPRVARMQKLKGW